jgi:hypothetical protein
MSPLGIPVESTWNPFTQRLSAPSITLILKTQITEKQMKVAELIHFWANGERQTIIEVRDVGDCVDLYEEEASRITVYFEAGAGAHVVAQFDNEETYMACFPALEQLAMLKGYTITESKGENHGN